jgi:S1-C subfamily serine protease
VSGIKPYELITHINDQPVTRVEDFKKLTADGGELRLAVKRMNTGRIVTVRLGTGDDKQSETED